MTGEEFEGTVRTYQGKLLGYARKLVRGDQAAEDLVQETLTNFWVQVSSGKEIKDIAAYLFQSLRNRAVNIYRHASNTDIIGLEQTWYSKQDVESVVENNLEIQTLFEKVNRLTATQRRVLIERSINGCSTLEVAKMMNISEGSVKMALYRARAELKKEPDESIWTKGLERTRHR